MSRHVYFSVAIEHDKRRPIDRNSNQILLNDTDQKYHTARSQLSSIALFILIDCSIRNCRLKFIMHWI